MSASNPLNGRKSQGAPSWMITFGDMMALLLTFFIMMLSFSTMDQAKYGQIAEALETTLGDGWQRKLGVVVGQRASADPAAIAAPQPASLESDLNATLAEEIRRHHVDVSMRGQAVVVRLPEQVAFATGSDTITHDFTAILRKIAPLLERADGRIVVSGHTDDRPIHTPRFRSNWDLSAARAVSVIHYLLAHTSLPPRRLVAQGLADTQPLEANDSAANRALNRRVEIAIRQGV